MNSQSTFPIFTLFKIIKMMVNQKFWITKLSESRLIYSRFLFEFCYWIKLYWYSCSIWDKLGWLNWLWQFPCGGLSSFNPKECCSCAWFCSLCKERISFCTGLISRKLFRFLFMFLTGSTSFSALLFFLLYWTPSLSLCMVSDAVSTNNRRGSLDQPIYYCVCLWRL